MTRATLYSSAPSDQTASPLGPLVVCCVAFRGPISLREQCWWERLHPVVARAREAASYCIDDSKRILACSQGRRLLESTVGAFLHEAGCTDLRLHRLIERLDGAGAASLVGEHWYEDGEGDGAAASGCPVLQAKLRDCELDFVSVQARVLFPAEFNRRLAECGNKAAVELEVVRELLAPHLTPDQPDEVYATVDRLGGRRYYRTVLEDLAGPTFLHTVQEGPDSSSYRFDDGVRQAQIQFEVKADARHLCVALASMIAKYLRERCMDGFNRFWRRQVPDVRSTAGYPADAQRFLDAVRPRLQALNVPMHAFWREK
jgi:hypothetical protein